MPRRSSWSSLIELRGAGGEPVDLARTLLSHGVADLPPNSIASDGSRLDTVLLAGGRAWALELVAARPVGAAAVGAGPVGAGPVGARLRVPAGTAVPPRDARRALEAQVRHMLRLDEDLSGFYAVAAADPVLAWSAAGAGRMLRSPTVFEDLVKTICTTNCTWSATERMVGAIVSELGVPAVGPVAAGAAVPADAAVPGDGAIAAGAEVPLDGGPVRRSFPPAAALADAGEEFFRDVARAGYRGPYLRALAVDVAEGRVDLEALNDPSLPDEVVAERLLSVAGVGPYAMAHMMMLLGRYRRLILDSWTRPTYRRLSGRPRVTDKGIERAYRRYREFAGLAFWLTLTEDWVGSRPA